MIRRPPRSPLFPSPPLSRSLRRGRGAPPARLRPRVAREGPAPEARGELTRAALPHRARGADRAVRRRPRPPQGGARQGPEGRERVAPRAPGVVGPRGRLPLRRLGDERLRAYPFPPRGGGPGHPGLRPGGVGAEVRLPRPAARARAGGRRGRARQHGGAPPAPPRGGVGARGPAHGVGALPGRGLARDLRRLPRGPRPADRDERRAVAGGAAPLMHRRGLDGPLRATPRTELRGRSPRSNSGKSDARLDAGAQPRTSSTSPDAKISAKTIRRNRTGSIRLKRPTPRAIPATAGAANTAAKRHTSRVRSPAHQ